MSELVKKLNAPSLKERLQKLQAGAGGPLAQRIAERLNIYRATVEQCLLLDVSGSMAEDCGDGRSKIFALNEIVGDFLSARKFYFATHCIESQIAGSCAGGTTDMAGAFIYVKQHGIRQAVLITDGIPDSEDAAFRSAVGLQIDIIYVGPPPEPPFLIRLARATGGHYGAGSLAQQKQIVDRVKSLLALPAPGCAR